jgi:hypothetical protein
MSTPTQINHVDVGLDRLLSQWDESPKLRGLLQSYLEQADELEEVLFQLLNERGIFTAIGVQLDVIGALFNLTRDGRTDTQFRNAILERANVVGDDGTTEVFMQSLRTHTNSNFVDFWEHQSGDVHALLGDGYYYNTWADIKKKVAAGVNLRIYVDDEFDSFEGSEVVEQVFDLQTNNAEDIQVTPDGITLYDLQVQFGGVASENAQLSILPEIQDITEKPYFAELLYTFVYAESGNIVDNTGEFIIDNETNTLIWVDYHF